jgi:hypothetical protein
MVERNEAACLLTGLLIEPCTRQFLRPREIEHAEPVRIARIVGAAELAVMLAPAVIPKTADPGAALGAFAIAQRASGRNNGPIRLASGGGGGRRRERAERPSILRLRTVLNPSCRAGLLGGGS